MREKIPLYIVAAFVLFLLVSALSGCRTKSVTEYVAVHDTLRLHHTDTVRLLSHERHTDTLRIETEKVVTLSVSGDTMKVVEVRDRWRDRVVLKTDTIYRAKTDTIYRVQQAEMQETIVARPTLWEKVKFALFLALCGLVAFAVGKWRRNRK